MPHDDLSANERFLAASEILQEEYLNRLLAKHRAGRLPQRDAEREGQQSDLGPDGFLSEPPSIPLGASENPLTAKPEREYVKKSVSLARTLDQYRHPCERRYAPRRG